MLGLLIGLLIGLWATSFMSAVQLLPLPLPLRRRMA